MLAGLGGEAGGDQPIALVLRCPGDPIRQIFFVQKLDRNSAIRLVDQGKGHFYAHEFVAELQNGERSAVCKDAASV